MSKPSDQIDTCQEERLQNKTATYYEGTPTVKQNTCKSVIVKRGEWLLYSETDFQGSCVQLPLAVEPVPYPTAESIGYNLIGHQDTLSKAEWGDQVSSLRPINQTDCLTKFLYRNLSGEKEEHQEGHYVPKLTEISSLVVRGRYAWELYPTGEPDFGYPWNDNKPLTVYPGKKHDILDVTKIPGYKEDGPLTVGLAKPAYYLRLPPCP